MLCCEQLLWVAGLSAGQQCCWAPASSRALLSYCSAGLIGEGSPRVCLGCHAGLACPLLTVDKCAGVCSVLYYMAVGHVEYAVAAAALLCIVRFHWWWQQHMAGHGPRQTGSHLTWPRCGCANAHRLWVHQKLGKPVLMHVRLSYQCRSKACRLSAEWLCLCCLQQGCTRMKLGSFCQC